MKISTKNISYMEIYDIGVNFKKVGKDYYDFFREYDSYSEDEQWFMLGYNGKTKPVVATGWRYGDFSDGGKSKNFQTGKIEPGLSLMEVYVDGVLTDRAEGFFEMFALAAGKKKYQVKGYWTPDIYGGDGEPLMLLPKHIK